ncbi:MAG: EAL domain-containing protein [Xanthomonadales bacterium]|nr:EAL domain-containing protein [Xanthomonadales bacterium]
MNKILLADTSQTRRRALSAVLSQSGYVVTAVATLAEAFDTLQRSQLGHASLDAVVLGWPEYSDGLVEDVFGLLHSERFEHLAVLIMADSSNANAVNWRMSRPRTALTLWSEYLEAPNAVGQLLRPNASIKPVLSEHDEQIRILLVDDSATVRAGYSRLLQKHGYHVDVAESVGEGWKKVSRQSYDIAIIDYLMPEQNGTALITLIRNDPATQHILTATITGTYSDAVISESLACGALECLFKSESRDLLLARIASVARTINDRKAIDNERRRLQGILSSVGEGVYGVDAEGIIQFINPAALDLLGYQDGNELIGHSAFDAFHYADENGMPMQRAASQLQQCYASGSEMSALQTRFWTSAKRGVLVECNVHPLRMDAEQTGSVVAFRDVSARRALEDELRWQAEHDSLTKLFNRGWFEAQLEQECNRVRRTGQAAMLLFIDLDRFKYINDTAGHVAGDRLLLEVSQRLKSRLRGSDYLARMGGDEFAVLLTNVGASDLMSLADGFRRVLTATPFTYGGKSYRITLSIGCAKIDDTAWSPGDAMAHADIACHMAKRSGRNQCQMYSAETGRLAAIDEDLGWSVRLEDALRTNRFVLCYQPIVPLKGMENDTVNSKNSKDIWLRQFERNPYEEALFEVLVRLQGSQGELISPNAFLPAAERFGLMQEIDFWVIDHALMALRETRDSPRPIALTINISAQTLEKAGITDFVTAKIVEYDVNPAAIVIEIIESHSINDIHNAQAQLTALRALGCRIAVDDFGTGFSTFAYLKQIEADILKIDGSLIQGLPHDDLDRTIIAALTSIAETAGKKTIAECVEDVAMLRTLYECGVDMAQGYVVGMPRLHLPKSLPTFGTTLFEPPKPVPVAGV